MSFEYLQLSLKSCPICGHDDFTPLNDNDRYFMGLNTVGCNNCGLLQINPRPSKAGIEHFYEHEYRKFYQGVITPDKEYIKQHHKNERMKYLVSFVKTFTSFNQNANILDIGCSEGVFFSALRDDGFLGGLYGIELNRSFANYAAVNNNAKVYSSIEELSVSCDLITVNHVFEHLLDPKEFLINIKRLLKDDGVILIDVPDAEEYQSLADLHLAHLFHYTTRTLGHLAELSGYKIISCEKHQPPFHPKSIRLVLVKDKLGSHEVNLSSASSEAEAWQKVKSISATSYKLKQLIAKIPYVKSIYYAFKKCA